MKSRVVLPRFNTDGLAEPSALEHLAGALAQGRRTAAVAITAGLKAIASNDSGR